MPKKLSSKMKDLPILSFRIEQNNHKKITLLSGITNRNIITIAEQVINEYLQNINFDQLYNDRINEINQIDIITLGRKTKSSNYVSLRMRLIPKTYGRLKLASNLLDMTMTDLLNSLLNKYLVNVDFNSLTQKALNEIK